MPTNKGASRPIIGRERALIDALAKLLYEAARNSHDYGPIRETERGSTFEVRVLSGGAMTGRVARVTIELDRVEASRV